MQKLTIIGNLTHSPDVRNTESGSMVCKFTVAVNATVNREKVATFYNVNAWGRLAEVCEKYLSKGAKVAVQGDLNARLYDGRDGVKRMSLDVRADEIEFLSSKQAADDPGDLPDDDCPVV